MPEAVRLPDFPRINAAIKLHTLLAFRRSILAFVDFSDGRSRDVNTTESVSLPKLAIVAKVHSGYLTRM